jgi:hypothetical protein
MMQDVSTFVWFVRLLGLSLEGEGVVHIKQKAGKRPLKRKPSAVTAIDELLENA